MLEQEFHAPHQLEAKAESIGKFSVEACRFRSNVEIFCGKRTVNAKSVLGLLSLNISSSVSFTLRIDGPDEKEAMRCLSELLQKRRAKRKDRNFSGGD